jgi:hypothetical protein
MTKTQMKSAMRLHIEEDRESQLASANPSDSYNAFAIPSVLLSQQVLSKKGETVVTAWLWWHSLDQDTSEKPPNCSYTPGNFQALLLPPHL